MFYSTLESIFRKYTHAAVHEVLYNCKPVALSFHHLDNKKEGGKVFWS